MAKISACALSRANPQKSSATINQGKVSVLTLTTLFLQREELIWPGEGVPAALLVPRTQLIVTENEAENSGSNRDGLRRWTRWEGRNAYKKSQLKKKVEEEEEDEEKKRERRKRSKQSPVSASSKRLVNPPARVNPTQPNPSSLPLPPSPPSEIDGFLSSPFPVESLSLYI